ncbi:MAG: hypothetical protein II900_05275 [Prevotella sp.]|nr:hypothetical protein [Prevotella sp.]
MLHDSGVIKLEGRDPPSFEPSVLEIEEDMDTDDYSHVSELFGNAIIENDFSDIDKILDEKVDLTLYGKK